MVGSVAAADLARDGHFEVTVADANRDALTSAATRAGGRIRTVVADLSDPDAVSRIVDGHDIAVGALPGSLGFEALRAAIACGTNVCDISFMAQDAIQLDESARDRGVTAVFDCGVAPGLSNMLAGHALDQMASCERIEIDVGGLPRSPEPPFYYKAPFSPADVIEEYTRPARLVEKGRIVAREALSEVEPFEVAGVGTLEAFNTDGLRSLLHTLNVPDMKERTLRYPGHAAMMRSFRDAGFFSTEPVSVRGVPVRPLEITKAMLFPKWKYDQGEEDLTVLRVVAEGRDAKGRPARLAWELVDSYDRITGTSSMARTTAFPCTIVARLIVAGRLTGPGVIPPEHLGRRPDLFRHVLDGLAERGITLKAS